jgi:hypothetical protein
LRSGVVRFLYRKASGRKQGESRIDPRKVGIKIAGLAKYIIALTRSYLYTCKCLQLQELTPAEAKDGQIRKCGCGLKYSLLRDLALATDSTITEYEYALATLPVHALAVQQHRRPAVISADWGYDKAGEVIWTGERQASGVQWRG